VGTDFYAQGTLGLTEDEQLKINAFDWEEEFKPRITRIDTTAKDTKDAKGEKKRKTTEGTENTEEKGLFDVVIGNPPYVFARDGGFKDYEKDYYYAHYKRQNYQLNTYSLFTERCYDLLKQKGRLGFIIPNNWLTIGTFAEYRKFILSETGANVIVNNLFKVFDAANVDTSLLTFVKITPSQVCLYESTRPEVYSHIADVAASALLSEPIIQFEKYKNVGSVPIVEKINSCSVTLKDIATVKSGLKAYETGKGTPKQTDKMKENRVYHSREKQDDSYRPYLEGADVKRYTLDWSGSFLKYGRNLAAPRKPELFEGERILVRQIPSQPPYCINACIVDGDYVNDINSMIIYHNQCPLNYLLAILNSRLVSWWFVITFNKFQRKTFPQFKVNELEQFPIPSVSSESSVVKNLSSLADQMLALKKREAAETVPQTQAMLSRQVAALDRAIDREVYKLYDLTDEEIAIVEGK
jgi:hypothetical protein